MHAILLYALKVIAASAIFMCYYYIALRNKTFHEWNRFYLLAVPIISLAIPLFSIPVYKTIEAIPMVVYESGNPPPVAITDNTTNWSGIFWMASIGLYTVGCIVLLLKMAIDYWKIIELRKASKNTQLQDGITLYYTDSSFAPFSFFKNIFWRNEISMQSPEGKQILDHEIVHVKEKHSTDKIFMQFIVCFGWCNPFFWLIRKELEMVHEFIADKKSAASSDIQALASAILKTVYPSSAYCFANNFFHSPIKRRLHMLTQKNKKSYAFTLKLLSLPVLLATFFTTVGYTQKIIVKDSKKDSSKVQVEGFRAVGKKGETKQEQKMNLPDTVLYFVNGKEVSKKEVEQLSPNDIHSIDVLKDKAAEKYGEKGKNAVILFTTKKRVSSNGNSIINSRIDTVSFNQKKENKLPQNALYYIDGKEFTFEEVENISTDNVESISVLKDESAIQQYGDKGKNGVVLVTTKKGSTEKKEVDKKLAFNNQTEAGAESVVLTDEKRGITLIAVKISIEKDPFKKGLQDKALCIIDGKEISWEALSKIKGDNIKSINIIKDESAVKKYGDKGKNGVIEITSKK